MATHVDEAAAALNPQGSNTPGPCAIVIFGAFGDLTKRLVTPAIYNLALTGLLPKDFAIIGFDRVEKTEDEFRGHLSDAMQSFVGGTGEFEPAKIDEAAWGNLTARMAYMVGDLESDASYETLKARLAAIAEKHGTGGNVIFYLAVADRFFGSVVDHLGKAGLVEEPEGGPYRRVVIEKPFGHDLQSARDLNARILQSLKESQIYRIDHFLGKETVQNIMAFRFANGMFEPLWNRDHIDHVQITVAETVGVEGRGSFYEATGALRDMVPNHVFQLLTMTAMEPPTSFDADAIRSKKVDVFSCIPSVQPDQAARGQYDAGAVLGKTVRAYRTEPNVSPGSTIETYVALRLEIDNWRWAGVPFYIRTGKYMTRRTTEIALRFKSAPTRLFEKTGPAHTHPSWLVLQIQPNEGISIQFDVKRPGTSMDLKAVKMNFAYKDWFPPQQNVGYETLIFDVMTGDQTLFQRADQVEQGWRIVQPVLDAWAREEPEEFPNYIAGTAGPACADMLLARDGGRSWRPVLVDDGPRRSPAAPASAPPVNSGAGKPS